MTTSNHPQSPTSITHEVIGSVSIDAIRDLLIKGEPFEDAMKEIRRKAQPPLTSEKGRPVAWLYQRYRIGRPTCVKIARLDAWNRTSPAVQLFFDRTRELPNGLDMITAITEAVFPLIGNTEQGASKETIADTITIALEPFAASGNWRVEPFLLPRKFVHERDRYAIEVEDHWVELLLGCVEEVFTKLDTSPHLRDAVARKNNQEAGFKERLRAFHKAGPKAFFTDRPIEEIDKFVHRQWMIASLWDDWDRALTKWDDRVSDLQRLGCDIELRTLQDFCKAEELVPKSPRIGKGGRPSHAAVRTKG